MASSSDVGDGTVVSAELATLLRNVDAGKAIARAVNLLSLDPTALSQIDCDKILVRIGEGTDLMAIHARFARAQVPLLFANRIRAESSPRMAAASQPRDKRPSGKIATTTGRHRKLLSDHQLKAFAASKRVKKSRIVQMLSAGVEEWDAERAVRQAAEQVGTRDPNAFGLDELQSVLDAIASRGPRWETEVQLVRTRLRSGSSF